MTSMELDSPVRNLSTNDLAASNEILKKSMAGWNTSLKTLSSAINDYSSASQDLCRLLESSENKDNTQLQVEKAYALIDNSFGFINKLEGTMLRAKRKLASMRNHSLSLSPINRLHPELLSSIFVIALDLQRMDLMKLEAGSETSSVAEDDRKIVPVPLIVSSVSRFWREVALDTARLWSEVDFHDPPPHNFTKLLLERSKRAPLLITLALTEMQNQSAVKLITGMIIPEHVSRIESLVISAAEIEQVEWVLSSFVNVLDNPPPLVELSISVPESPGELIEVQAPSSRRAQLVNLMRGIQRLSLEGVRFPWATPAFSNLTHFRLAANSPSEGCRPTKREFIAILKASPALESLIISETGVQMEEEDDDDDDDDDSPYPPVEMRSLQVLELMEVAWDQLVFILQIIQAPNLRGLRICDPTERFDQDGDPLDDDPDNPDGDEAVYNGIMSFLTRLQNTEVAEPEQDTSATSPSESISPGARSSPLRSLELEGVCDVQLGTERLTKLLAKVPLIKALSLIALDFDDDLLGHMQGVWGPGSTIPSELRTDKVLCPNINYLKVEVVDGLTTGAVVALAQYRHAQKKPIETMRLADFEPENSDLKALLRPFVKNVTVGGGEIPFLS